MRRYAGLAVVLITISIPISASAQYEYFAIRLVTEAEIYTFVKVFSEMRGPLRQEILKDKKTDFRDADPLKYVSKVKKKDDVVKTLRENGISWGQFNELMGNVLLAYLSIQPEKTKTALIRQLAGYGLMMSNDQIPAEYRPVIEEVLKTDEGAAMAGMALEFVVQIPPGNVELAKKNSRTLDQLFYTRLWRDKL